MNSLFLPLKIVIKMNDVCWCGLILGVDEVYVCLKMDSTVRSFAQQWNNIHRLTGKKILSNVVKRAWSSKTYFSFLHYFKSRHDSIRLFIVYSHLSSQIKYSKNSIMGSEA